MNAGDALVEELLAESDGVFGAEVLDGFAVVAVALQFVVQPAGHVGAAETAEAFDVTVIGDGHDARGDGHIDTVFLA